MTQFLIDFNTMFGEVLLLLGHIAEFVLSQPVFLALICLIFSGVVIQIVVSLFSSLVHGD